MILEGSMKLINEIEAIFFEVSVCWSLKIMPQLSHACSFPSP